MTGSGTFNALAVASTLLFATAAHADEVQVARGACTLQADVRGDGAMTVVFESGFGQAGGAWKDVVNRLGADCRCITYARAGLGKSGGTGKPERIDERVADLEAVIGAFAPGRKAVLVGHSYGGLLATEYARRHPERLQALVLVDAATMGQRHAFMQADRTRVQVDDAALLKRLPPALGADYRTLIAQLDAPAAATPTSMPDVPVALLTSTNVPAEPFVFEETVRGEALWKAQHSVLFSAFTRGTHRYLAMGHDIQREDPAAVVDAIRSVAAHEVP